MAIFLSDTESRLLSALNNSGQVPQMVETQDEAGNAVSGMEVQDLSVQDVVGSNDLVRFMPKVIQVVLRQAIEPDAIITQNCFTEIDLPGRTQIQIGAIGALTVGKVSEKGEYPEAMINLGSGGEMIGLNVNKYGLQLGFSDEVIEESQWPLINIWLQQAGRAFARHQEGLALDIVDTFGTDVLDNAAPGATELGNCTGRDITGAANGSMSINDLFEMYSYLALRGFTPDTLMVHPLGWKTFALDPDVREVILNGATLVSNRLPNGSPSPGWGPTPFSGLGLRTIATGGSDADRNNFPMPNAYTNTLNPLGATFQIAPRYMPTPLRVLVTPYVPFAANGAGHRIPTTNIYMLDSRRCGVFAVRERPTTEEWREPSRDVQYMKLRARYGFGILEQGKGIAIARNVVVDRNYVFDNVNNATLSTIDRDTIVP